MQTLLQNLNTYIIEYCYGKPQELALNDGLYEKLSPIIALMKEKNTRYLLGDNLCFIDFYMYECIELLDFMTQGQVYSDYPELYNHSSVMSSVLEPFFSKNHISFSYPFFHRFTQYNNWPDVNFKNRWAYRVFWTINHTLKHSVLPWNVLHINYNFIIYNNFSKHNYRFYSIFKKKIKISKAHFIKMTDSVIKHYST